MKLFVDNKLIQIISSNEEKKHALIKACRTAGILTDDRHLHITFAWPSLLEYLGLAALLENFPTFHSQHELFSFILNILPRESEKELLIRAYDQVFVECLTHVKALPQMDPNFLLTRIQQKRPSSPLSISLFAQSLANYEKRLLEHPSHVMHDLILYLAWDRVCVNLAIVFEHAPSNANIQSGLIVLKECLLESFQHITAHGRTAPGFFRLIETLYAYQMREENLQIYTDDEWSILSQSAAALKPRELLNDVWYIDAAIIDQKQLKSDERPPIRVLTMDSPERVQAGLSLARYMIHQLKESALEWRYSLAPIEVVCLKEEKSTFSVDAVVKIEH